MPFLSELSLRTLTRLVVLSLVLPLLVVAIDQSTGSGASWQRTAGARWVELAALSVAIVVVDTVAAVQGAEARGAASLGIGRHRWMGAILVPAVAFTALVTAVGLSLASEPTATLVTLDRAELEALAASACTATDRPVTTGAHTMSHHDTGATIWPRAWVEPWLGLVVALATLWCAPRLTRAVGLGADLGRTRAVGLVVTLLMAAVTLATWRVILAIV